MSQPENKMGVMPENKLLLNMALPMIASMLIQACYNVVDSYFVSKLSQDALNAVSLAFPVQNLMIAVAVGTAMFGPLRCSIYSFIGIVLGSIVAYAIGKIVGYKAVCWIVGKENLDKWQQKLKGKDYLILSLMFLLPLFPDDILCFIAGMSSMTWGYFLVMITITRAISIFSSAFSFELIPFTTWWGIMIWIVIAALVFISFWLVCKHYEKIDRFIKDKFKFKRKKR